MFYLAWRTLRDSISGTIRPAICRLNASEISRVLRVKDHDCVSGRLCDVHILYSVYASVSKGREPSAKFNPDCSARSTQSEVRTSSRCKMARYTSVFVRFRNSAEPTRSRAPCVAHRARFWSAPRRFFSRCRWKTAANGIAKKCRRNGSP